MCDFFGIAYRNIFDRPNIAMYRKSLQHALWGSSERLSSKARLVVSDRRSRVTPQHAVGLQWRSEGVLEGAHRPERQSGGGGKNGGEWGPGISQLWVRQNCR